MKKLGLLFISILFVLFAFTTTVSAAEEKSMNIYGLYLSFEGDATLIESDGEWLLIDTGIDKSSQELMRALEKYNINKLDILISHLHSDHIGGMDAFADSDILIETIYMPKKSLTEYYDNTNYFYNRVMESARANNPDVKEVSLEKDSDFKFGDVKAVVLGPINNLKPDDFDYTNNQEPIEHYVNCRSLTVRFDCGETSFLACGDIELEEEKALVKEYKGTNKLNADILKLNHHALPNSNSEDFLKAVSPKYSFAHNSGKIYSGDSDYRLYYNSCKNASKYGPVYLIGDEKNDFGAKVLNNSIKIYRGTKQLTGLVTLAGGDGTKVKTDKYYISDKTVKEGVYTIGDKKYYIFDGGYVKKAFYSFDNKKYIYRFEKGKDVRYVDEEGVLYTGFHKINGYYYYFSKKTGVRVEGDEDFSPVKIGSKKYAINENGVIYNYAKKTGTWKKYGSNYRYFDKNGVMKTGWLTLNGKKYYLSKKTGFRLVGLKEIGGKKYYFVEKNKAAYAYSKGWKKVGSNYRYFNKNGVMQTGWKTIGGKKYYFSKKTGFRLVGLKKVSGKTYYFVEKNKAAYVWKGWKSFGGKKRYFDKNGVMVTGKKKINGKVYRFDKKGYLKK